MQIRDKNFLGFLFAIAAVFGLILWGGLPATADDKGINFTYEIDMNAANSGVTTTQGNRTIKDIQTLVGASKKCMLVLKHSGSGVTKACIIGSGVTLTDNFYLDIRPGAELVVNASSWIASPGHIIMAPNQRVVSTASTKSLYFTSDHLKFSAYNGGTTTVELPSAKISTLTLGTGVGVNEFSNDTTLAGNSDLAVPTEKAIKTYVDTIFTVPTYYKSNLKIMPPGSSGVTNADSDSKITVTADELAMSNLSGSTIIVSGVSVMGAITVSGANGLDTGGEAVSTFYNIYVCRYLGGTTNFALLSTSATSPNIPTSAYRRLVGEVYNKANGHFLLFRCDDDEVKLYEPLDIYSNQSLTTAYKTYTLPNPVASVDWCSIDFLATSTNEAWLGIIISGTTLPAIPHCSMFGDSATGVDSNNFGAGYNPHVGRLHRIGTASTIYIRVNNGTIDTGNNLQILGYRRVRK
jgi:hypothetical protein